MEVISRKAAHEKGMLRFFTGKPCKRGHVRERNVKTGACLGCLAHYAKEYAGRFNDEALGFEQVSIAARGEDVPAIRQFAELCKLARINGTPVPMVPHIDHIAAMNTFLQMMVPHVMTETHVSATEAKHALWARIHGKDVADQMIDMEIAQNKLLT